MATLAHSSVASLQTQAYRPVGSERSFAAAGLPALRIASRRVHSARLVRPAALRPTALWKSEKTDVQAEARNGGLLGASASQALALVAAGALMLAPMVIDTPPADAAQGGGRVGGSSGFARSRSAPPPQAAAPSVSSPVVVSPTIIAPVMPFGGFFAPPPLFGGFGWSPFGYGVPGVTVVAAGPSFGFIFGTILFFVVATVAISVVTSIFRRD